MQITMGRALQLKVQMIPFNDERIFSVEYP